MSLLTYDIKVKKYFETRSSSGFLIVNNENLKNLHWKAYIKIVTRFISGKGKQKQNKYISMEGIHAARVATQVDSLLAMRYRIPRLLGS